jgi:glycosyltransferase involved in cell wall biosynthesis
MKIMHLLKHCQDCNGHVNVAVDLACTQVALGHEVVLASAGGHYEPLLTAHGVEHVEIPHAGGLGGAARTLRSTVAAARRFRPDVLHAHMMTSAVMGFAAARTVRAPLVTTMHNSFDRHSVLMRLGDVVAAVSDAERRLLLTRGYPEGKVVTVLNGVDGSPREPAGTSSDAPGEDVAEQVARPCVMTLSGLHRRKGIDDVIGAFAQVKPEFPHWHLNIVGGGPDRDDLGRLVAELGLDSSVHFVGASERPRALLRQAEIFASGALAEPFGLAVAEARTAGCAIVATAVGGVPEVVDHGRAGRLTPAAEPAAMAAVFRTWMGDDGERSTWRARAAAGAEYFTVERMAQDYLRLYKEAQ